MTADPPPSTTAPYYADESVTLHLGEMLDVLPTLPDASVDAVVCDPPYGLANLHPRVIAEALAAWLAGDRAYVPEGAGFMGAAWDGFVPPPAAWDECLRVLKPGGHLVAFAAPRTADLMGISIRLAGFEIRDSLAWHFGSGFPKSLDVSKAIDKRRDWSLVERLSGEIRRARAQAALSLAEIGAQMQIATEGQYGKWYHRGGHMFFETGRGLPSRPEWEHLRRVLPIAEEFAEVYKEAEREVLSERVTEVKGGTWSEMAPSGRFKPGEKVIRETAPATDDAARWQGWGTALKPAHEPIVLARKPLAGTVAATVLQHGTGALNIDATRTVAACASVVGLGSNRNGDAYGEWTGIREDSASDLGRWPTNVLLGHGPDCAEQCAPGCPVADMDRQSGVLTSGKMRAGIERSNRSGWAGDMPAATGGETYGDTGGASRFFPVFRYEAKAPASERPRLADGTAHPTTKPLDLMRWLIRLVTPPGGLVLDPFAGSGTTLEAAAIEGFRAVGVERHEPYAELCRVRLTKPLEAVLFGDVLGEAS